MKCLVILAGFVLFAAAIQAQSDSLEEYTAERNLRIHRTTVAGALVPGAGQILNKKYWKAPVVWGAVWWTASAIQFNSDEFRFYRDALIRENDDDPSTLNETGFSALELNDRALFYRRQRDVSALALLGIHALSILDANVDAHLMEFDVSDNLKAAFNVNTTPSGIAYWGFAMRWDLSKIAQSHLPYHARW